MDARPGQGFPSSCRLRKSREYTEVWRQGRRCHTAHLLVIAASGATTRSRLGISVGRKVGNAVCRNRIKRWLREFFRWRLAGIDDATDFSVVVKAGAASVSHAELDRELQEAFSRLKVNGDA